MSSQLQPWGTQSTYPEPQSEPRWSRRRTLVVVILSSTALWSVLGVAGQVAWSL